MQTISCHLRWTVVDRQNNICTNVHRFLDVARNLQCQWFWTSRKNRSFLLPLNWRICTRVRGHIFLHLISRPCSSTWLGWCDRVTRRRKRKPNEATQSAQAESGPTRGTRHFKPSALDSIHVTRLCTWCNLPILRCLMFLWISNEEVCYGWWH